MSRSVLLTAFAAVLAGAAVSAAAWWWWTAPPSSSGTDLAIAADWAPADAEGVLVVTQARRLGRWLARHRAAGLLAAAAAPAARSGAQPLEPIAPSLARTARGPVVAWWGESSTGLAARVASTDVEGLRQVAALRSLGWREEGVDSGLVRVSVFHGVPGAGPAQFPYLPPTAAGSWSALARVRGTWWRIRLSRGRVTVHSGTPPALPQCHEETLIVSADLSLLLARGALPAAVPGALLIAADGGWGVHLGETTSSSTLERVVRTLGGWREAAGDPSVQEWRSPFGTLFLSAQPGVGIATRAELLARLPLPTRDGEWGCVRGEQIANALGGSAALLDRLPGMPPRERVTLLAESLRQVDVCSWRVEPAGGHLDLQW